MHLGLKEPDFPSSLDGRESVDTWEKIGNMCASVKDFEADGVSQRHRKTFHGDVQWLVYRLIYT